jgi:hypothetical protein
MVPYFSRMMYVNRHTVRLVGKQIQHGPARDGFPVVSQIEQRQKEKKQKPNYQNHWRDEFFQTGKSVRVLEADAAEANKDVVRLEKEVKALKDNIEGLTTEKRTLGNEKRSLATEGQQGGSSETDKLWPTKQNLRTKRNQYLELEEQLRQRRSTRHCLNMMIKAAPSNDDMSSGEASSSRSSNRNANTNATTNSCQMTKPSYQTLARRTKPNLSISQICRPATRLSLSLEALTMVCTMSKTVPPTTDIVQAHMNRFWVLRGKCLSNKMSIMKGVNNSLTRARLRV